jgi:nitrogen-specific signal transduction histidine kinase
MGKRDITRTIISTNTIQHNLTSIFTDSIILKDNFEIAALSNGVADLVGYSHDELIEKPIDFLAHGSPIVYRLKDELQHGFFEKITLPLRTKNFGFVTCHLSGFYLGLISDLTGYIVLRIKPVDEINFLNRQLERSHQELDEFIYRASHDLRGPLATIRGLTNLMKLQEPDDEMKSLIMMLDASATKMDDRLSRLHYLSEIGHSDASSIHLNCHELETSLRATLEENIHIDQIQFHFSAFDNVVPEFNGQAIISMLNNILLYLLQLPQNETKHLICSIKRSDNGLQMSVHSLGFIADYPVRQAINQKASLYSNVITYSQLINYYAAQKVAQTLKASLWVNFLNEDEQKISAFIPHRTAN